MPVSPVAAEKKQFSVESPSTNRLSIEVALEKSFEKLSARRGGRDWHNVPVFEVGYKLQLHCIYV